MPHDGTGPAEAHVLLVEDDPDLQVTTRLVLEQHGFRVSVAGDGLEGLALAEAERPDVALVDIVLPGLDGISLTRRLRELADLPIVLLTARDLPHDEVLGLDAGADDYLTKPFDGTVLAARLRSVLRRAGGRSPRVHEVGDLVVDRSAMTASRGGRPVSLSTTEFRLLEAFLEHRNAVLSRAQLLELVWGTEEWGNGRVIDVNIGRLRAKLGPGLIETVRGAGYKLVDP